MAEDDIEDVRKVMRQRRRVLLSRIPAPPRWLTLAGSVAAAAFAVYYFFNNDSSWWGALALSIVLMDDAGEE